MDIFATSTNSHHLNIANNIYRVFCSCNYLKKLYLPDNLLVLSCWSNNINKLNLNNNLIELRCDIFVCVNNINNNKLIIEFF